MMLPNTRVALLHGGTSRQGAFTDDDRSRLVPDNQSLFSSRCCSRHACDLSNYTYRSLPLKPAGVDTEACDLL
jgi:hypothetical protein